MRPTSPQSSPPITQEEVRGAFRARSIETIAHAGGDVNAFLEELEAKRKQLDDQIQRYIKQKDREFKLFERDLRPKYRNKPVKQEGNTAKASEESAYNATGTSSLTSSAGRTLDSNQNDDESQVSTDKRATKPKTTHERETELLGLFTPVYLPLLDKESDPTTRSPSAPAQLVSLEPREQPVPDPLQRAHSDSIVVAASPSNPERLKIEHRSLSGGLEPIKPLVGVLRASTGQARLPKKRVSLVVGDEIVVPSDDVSVSTPPLKDASVPEVSSNVSAMPVQAETQPGNNDENAAVLCAEMTENVSNNDRETEAVPRLFRQNGSPVSKSPTMPISALSSSLANRPSTEDDDLDMESPFTMDDDPAPRERQPWSDSMLDLPDDEAGPEFDTQDHAEQIEDVQFGVPDSPATPSPGASIPKSPRNALSTPSLSISHVRTASSASLQPVSPGFSRPSVKEDPQAFFGNNAEDINTPEIEDNKSYGSFSQSGSYMGRKGSLGESFMQRNAMEMMKRRQSGGNSAV